LVVSRIEISLARRAAGYCRWMEAALDNRA